VVRHAVEVVDAAGGADGGVGRHVEPVERKVNGRAELPSVPLRG